MSHRPHGDFQVEVQRAVLRSSVFWHCRWHPDIQTHPERQLLQCCLIACIATPFLKNENGFMFVTEQEKWSRAGLDLGLVQLDDATLYSSNKKDPMVLVVDTNSCSIKNSFHFASVYAQSLPKTKGWRCRPTAIYMTLSPGGRDGWCRAWLFRCVPDHDVVKQGDVYVPGCDGSATFPYFLHLSNYDANDKRLLWKTKDAGGLVMDPGKGKCVHPPHQCQEFVIVSDDCCSHGYRHLRAWASLVHRGNIFWFWRAKKLHAEAHV